MATAQELAQALVFGRRDRLWEQTVAVGVPFLPEKERPAFIVNCANVVLNRIPRSIDPDDVNPRELARLILAHYHDRRLAQEA
jgi:hypothetical protein